MMLRRDELRQDGGCKMGNMTVFERWAALVPGRLERLRNDREEVRRMKLTGSSPHSSWSARQGVASLRREMIVASARTLPNCRLGGTTADRLRASREELVRRQLKIGFRYAAQGHTTDIRLIRDNVGRAGLETEVGRCYPYKGSRRTYPANTTQWTVSIPASWHRRTDTLGYMWIGIGRFVLDCVPRAEAGGIEHFDAVTVVQGRGLEIRTEIGIIAVDREGGLVAFGTTIETARRSMYSTAAGKAVVAGRRAAAQTARQRLAREAAAQAVREAEALGAFLLSLPRSGTRRSQAPKATGSVT
jgi:hypothetical protein